MKVYIQVDDEGIPRSKNFAYAYYGFHEMGFEIRYFKRVTDIIDNNPEDVIVGYVNEVKYMLQKQNCDTTEFDYPEELHKYLGRRIWKSTVNEINNNPNLWPVFMKPLETKLFTGVVVRSTHDLIGCGAKPEAECYCSEIVNFVSEWRVFVRYGKIMDVKHYFGDWKLHYDANIIEACLDDYESQPAGFTMDFGLTDDGRTLLIEVNDGYSIGCYGLDPIDYAKLLSARWAELTNTEDECDFMNDKISWNSSKEDIDENVNNRYFELNEVSGVLLETSTIMYNYDENSYYDILSICDNKISYCRYNSHTNKLVSNWMINDISNDYLDKYNDLILTIIEEYNSPLNLNIEMTDCGCTIIKVLLNDGSIVKWREDGSLNGIVAEKLLKLIPKGLKYPDFINWAVTSEDEVK